MDAKVRNSTLFLMLCASVPLVAHAQTVGDLADVQADTLLFKAQAARAEALVKLGDANRQGSRENAADSGSDTLPVVRGVYGTAGKLYATFLYANGSSVDAGNGDVVPGGYVVRSLSATRVQLARRGRSYTLGFSDLRPLTATEPSGGGSAPPASSIPPLLPPSMPGN